MKAYEALAAIHARQQGEFDRPCLMVIGPLSTVDADVLKIKRLFLEDCGFIIGPRDPQINPNYSGSLMVSECYDDPDEEPWAIVGDSLPELLAAAFDFASEVYDDERS